MSGYKNPPKFDSINKPYDRYIEELKTWCFVTELEKERQAPAVILSFPEEDPSGIRDKVFNELKLDEVSQKYGIKKLITYLDKLFKKDELSEVYERYTLFN